MSGKIFRLSLFFLPRGLSIKIETNVFDLGGLKFVQDVRTAIGEDVISAKFAESPWHLNSKLIMTMKNMEPPLTLLAAQPKRIFGEIHQSPTCSTYSLGMYTILAGPLNRMISVHLHISLIQIYRFSTPLIESINQFFESDKFGRLTFSFHTICAFNSVKPNNRTVS